MNSFISNLRSCEVVLEVSIKGSAAFLLYLYINFPKNPIMSAEIKTEANIALPILLSANRETPTVLERNAEPGMFENVRTRSNSDLDTSPRSYSETAVFAPTGKPQKTPRIKAQDAAPDIPNRKRMGTAKTLPISLPIPLATSNSDIAIKGKSEGITVFAQSDRPSVIYFIATSGFRRMTAKEKTLIRQNRNLLILIPFILLREI